MLSKIYFFIKYFSLKSESLVEKEKKKLKSLSLLRNILSFELP